MAQHFQEFVCGDVQVAPFVTIATLAFIVILLLRPILARIGFRHIFLAPGAVMFCLYIVIVSLLVVEA
jgi:hypothetical protein